MKPKIFKKETPRKRILRLRAQVESLDDRFPIKHSSPCLCTFCTGFWFEKGYEDCDFGCNYRKDTNENLGWDMVKCSKFIPSKGWGISCEQFLVNCLYEAIDGVAPYMGKIDSLKSKVKELEMLADRAKEATEQYARWNDMLEVLARMKTNKLNPPANP